MSTRQIFVNNIVPKKINSPQEIITFFNTTEIEKTQQYDYDD